jgi:A/G-specific adenine glycosylase
MPWKGEKDAYKIWLSEIILQQTRVEQGLQYYKNFIRVFPDVHKLAKAPDNKVFKLWEGLGYYSRCRNLLASARIISKEHKGKFPDTYESIKNLKGVGPYTAAAISSFAFNLPHAVVDGNVFRVIARVLASQNRPIRRREKNSLQLLPKSYLIKINPVFTTRPSWISGLLSVNHSHPYAKNVFFKNSATHLTTIKSMNCR